LQYYSDGVEITDGQTIRVDPGIVTFSIEGAPECTDFFAVLSGNAVFKGPVCPIEFWPEPCDWPIIEIDWNGGKAQMMLITSDIPVIEPGKIRTLSFDMIVSGGSTLDILDMSAESLLQVNYIIPEPATLALLGGGMILLGRRKHIS
jgi:hypothetical protein